MTLYSLQTMFFVLFQVFSRSTGIHGIHGIHGHNPVICTVGVQLVTDIIVY